MQAALVGTPRAGVCSAQGPPSFVLLMPAGASPSRSQPDARTSSTVLLFGLASHGPAVLDVVPPVGCSSARRLIAAVDG